MERSKKPGRFSSGTITIVPWTLAGSSSRPSRIAARIPVYSAACMPAVNTKVGPPSAPTTAKYGHSYFPRLSSGSSNVKYPLALSPWFGSGIGPIDSVTTLPTPPAYSLFRSVGGQRRTLQALDQHFAQTHD